MSSEEPPSKRKVAFEEEPDEDEEEEEEEYDDEDGEEEEEESLIENLLANTLATPDGDTLCGTLVKISNTLETQNKILIKLLSALSTKKAA